MEDWAAKPEKERDNKDHLRRSNWSTTVVSAEVCKGQFSNLARHGQSTTARLWMDDGYVRASRADLYPSEPTVFPDRQADGCSPTKVESPSR
ncbi:hypothetical protein MGG_15286 [Pyricularia oryzae 70-15]|uniref:Uncharacterized protein n=3 Tax=Pyricularia oryzae TaxID=318829 RepID=G4N6S4_PYRO7|nr:uncharacterized protein MGG_15286 [Pyricularia oryzae 70-15]EHA49891.1 hypothetical protein MGG_15286 [Pyricularia oryzae 70-15]ELQ38316.1 hypothetical protein OOU_Y34scaffold00542g8 [Pyricularia oryzae Y34]